MTLLTSATPIQPHSPAKSYLQQKPTSDFLPAGRKPAPYVDGHETGVSYCQRTDSSTTLPLVYQSSECVEDNSKKAGFSLTFYGAHYISPSTFSPTPG